MRTCSLDHFTGSVQSLMGVMPPEKDGDPDTETCGE